MVFCMIMNFLSNFFWKNIKFINLKVFVALECYIIEREKDTKILKLKKKESRVVVLPCSKYRKSIYSCLLQHVSRELYFSTHCPHFWWEELVVTQPHHASFYSFLSKIISRLDFLAVGGFVGLQTGHGRWTINSIARSMGICTIPFCWSIQA